MASGPWHYREAERLIAVVDDGQAVDTMMSEGQLLAMAQVHATLALAAATALLGPVAAEDNSHDPDYSAWIKAACETTQAEPKVGGDPR